MSEPNRILIQAPRPVEIPDGRPAGVPIQTRPPGVPPTEPDFPWHVNVAWPSELAWPSTIKTLTEMASLLEPNEALHIRIGSASHVDIEDLAPAAEVLKQSRASLLHIRIDRHG